MAKKQVKVIINEQHKLFVEQIRQLNDQFGEGGWIEYKISAQGISTAEQKRILFELFKLDDRIVFASPINPMLTWASNIGFETYMFKTEKRATEEKDGVAVTNYNKLKYELINIEEEFKKV